MFSTRVLFADSGDSGIDCFATIHELYRCLSEEEQNVLPNVKWTDEVCFCNKIKGLVISLTKHMVSSIQAIAKYSLSNHFESYFNVLLKLNFFCPVRKSNRSLRKMTGSALVNSALVPAYNAGRAPGFPLLTHTAVLLSAGSYGHLATPRPMPGMYSCLGRWVKFNCNHLFYEYLYYYFLIINQQLADLGFLLWLKKS